MVVNTPDMTETLLRSMIISGTWTPIMTPVHSTINLIAWAVNVESYSLCHCDTSLVRDLIISIIIPSSISLPTSAIYSFPWYFILVTKSHAAASDVISPSGPRVSFRHADGQIPLLIHTPLRIPLEYLSCTFMITLLRCDGWCNQSILRR